MLNPQERIKMAADHLRELVIEYQEYIDILDNAYDLREKHDPKFRLGIEASEKYARANELSRKIIKED